MMRFSSLVLFLPLPCPCTPSFFHLRCRFGTCETRGASKRGGGEPNKTLASLAVSTLLVTVVCSPLITRKRRVALIASL